MVGALAGGVIKLCVPAKASMMLVIRLTTAGVMAKAGLTMDAMEDLKLAIEEACNCMIQNSECDELQLVFSSHRNAIEISVGGIGEKDKIDCDKADADELQVIQCILRSMVDDVRILHAEGKLCAIEMTKQIACLELSPSGYPNGCIL